MSDQYRTALSNLVAAMETPRSQKATGPWRAALDLVYREKPTLPRWRCQDCGSTDIHVSFPTWYAETVSEHRTSQASDLEYVDVDGEADPSYFCCACDSTETPFDLTDPEEYRDSVKRHGAVPK